MNTSELKLNIIQKITELKEVRVIEEIKRLLDFELIKVFMSCQKLKKTE